MKMLVVNATIILAMSDDETQRAAMNRLAGKLTDANIEIINPTSVNVCKIPRLDEDDENDS